MWGFSPLTSTSLPLAFSRSSPSTFIFYLFFFLFMFSKNNRGSCVRLLLLTSFKMFKLIMTWNRIKSITVFLGASYRFSHHFLLETDAVTVRSPICFFFFHFLLDKLSCEIKSSTKLLISSGFSHASFLLGYTILSMLPKRCARTFFFYCFYYLTDIILKLLQPF